MSRADTNGATPAVTADDILLLDDLAYATVPVPEWGARLTPPQPDYSVRIRTLTILEVEQLMKDATVSDGHGGERRDMTRYNQALFALGVVAPAFSPAQVKALWVHSSVPIGRIIEALQQLNRTARPADEEVAAATAAFPAQPAEAPTL